MSSHHIVSTLLYLLEDAASYLLCVLEVLEVLGYTYVSWGAWTARGAWALCLP